LSIINKFIKGSLLLSIASVVVRISGFLVLVPLARLLGAEKLGVYSLIFWLVQTGTMLGRLGVDVAIHRNGAKLYQTDSTATGRLLGVGGTLMSLSFAALATVTWVCREPLATHWLGNKDAAQWLGYAAIILCLEGLGTVMMTYLISLHSFQGNSLATSAGALGKLLLSPALAFNYGLYGAIIGLLLGTLLQLLVATISCYRSIQKYQIQLSLENFWQESSQILQFGLPFYAGNALIGLVALPMMGEIGRVAGVKTLGQLRIAQSLSQIVGFLPAAIAPVATSLLSEAYGKEGQDFQKLRSVHLRGNWLLALILVVSVSLSSHLLINLLFGNTYKDSVPLIIGLSWWTSLTVVVENLNLYTLAAGNTWAIAVGSVVQKITFIILAFWLIHHWGGMGYIFGLLIGSSLQFLIMIFNIWKQIEIILRKQILLLLAWSITSLLSIYSIENLKLAENIKITVYPLILVTIITLLIWSVITAKEREIIQGKAFQYKIFNR
jgi:O-antigen/teichoic acid export membrane protein